MVMKDHFAIETIETTMISDLGNIHFRTPQTQPWRYETNIAGPQAVWDQSHFYQKPQETSSSHGQDPKDWSTSCPCEKPRNFSDIEWKFYFLWTCSVYLDSKYTWKIGKSPKSKWESWLQSALFPNKSSLHHWFPSNHHACWLHPTFSQPWWNPNCSWDWSQKRGWK